MSAVPEFTWSDAWLLHAVAVAGGSTGGALLADVLGAGDMIQHAGFTNAELRRGFGKLTSVGLVTESEERFHLTEEARAAWDRVESFQSVRRQQEELEKFLKAAPYPAGDDPGFEDPEWPYPSLSDARIKKADAEYQKRMKVVLRTVMKGKR